MNVGFLKNFLSGLDDGSDVVVFVMSENRVYRPFRNVELSVLNEGSCLEEVHLDVSVFKEFRNVHFRDNLSEDEVDDLLDRRRMLVEELEDVDELLGDFL